MPRRIVASSPSTRLYQLIDDTWHLFPVKPSNGTISPGVWGGPNGTLWAHNYLTDASRRFLFYDGEAWTEYEHPSMGRPHCIHGSDNGSYVYAATGYTGTVGIQRFNAGVWTIATTSWSPNTIWCNSTGQHVIAGPYSWVNEILYSSDYGVTWNNVWSQCQTDIGTSPGTIGSVWGINNGSECTLYVSTSTSNTSGYVLGYDTSVGTWEIIASSSSYNLGTYGLWGESADNLFVLGTDQRIDNNGNWFIAKIVGSDVVTKQACVADAVCWNAYVSFGRNLIGIGNTIVAVFAAKWDAYQKHVYTSTDGGETWVRTQPDIINHFFAGLTTWDPSAPALPAGKRYLGVNDGGYNKVYYLDDADEWVKFPIDHWTGITGGVWGVPDGKIWICSTTYPARFNGVDAWEEIYSAGLTTEAHRAIQGSDDGSYVYFCAIGGDVIRYHDGAWSETTAGGYSQSIWCNSTGQYVMTDTWYFSDDYGQTWTHMRADCEAQLGYGIGGDTTAVWGFSAGSEAVIILSTDLSHYDGSIIAYDTATGVWTRPVVDPGYDSAEGEMLWGQTIDDFVLLVNNGSTSAFAKRDGSTWVRNFTLANPHGTTTSNSGRTMIGITDDDTIIAVGGYYNGDWGTFPGGWASRTWKSTDNGESWVKLATEIELLKTVSFWQTGTPPYLQNQDPAPAEIGALPTDPIAFDLVDDDDNLNASSVVIKVNTVTVWTGDAQQPGYTVTKTPVANGFHYEIYSDTGWDPGTVTVEVYAEDLA